MPVFILTVWLVTSLLIRENSELERAWADISSCCVLNMSAIDSADVLMVEESVLDATNNADSGLGGVFITKTTKTRVKFDFSKSQLAFVKVTEIEGVDFRQNSKEITGVERSGAWVNGSFEKPHRFLNSKITKFNLGMVDKETNRNLKIIGFPDPRSVPFTGYIGFWQPHDLTKPIVPSVLSSGAGLTSSYRSRDFLDLKYENKMREVDGRLLHSQLRYDVRSLMPTSFKVQQVDEADPEIRGLLIDVSIDWSEVDHFQVPVLVKRVEPSTFRINNQRVPGFSDSTIRLHWFSVNESPFSSGFFDSLKKLDDEFIHNLVDPKAARAYSLTNHKKKSKPNSK